MLDWSFSREADGLAKATARTRKDAPDARGGRDGRPQLALFDGAARAEKAAPPAPATAAARPETANVADEKEEAEPRPGPKPVAVPARRVTAETLAKGQRE